VLDVPEAEIGEGANDINVLAINRLIINLETEGDLELANTLNV
jgi:hypothetical protein